MWSLGVIVYILLGGYPPFVEQNQRELFRKIRKGQFEFHEEYWGCVSTEAKGLISALLTVKATQRLSADGTLVNAWVTEGDDVLGGKDLGKNLIELRKFNGKRKFRAAIHAVSLDVFLNPLNFAPFIAHSSPFFILRLFFPFSSYLQTNSKHSMWNQRRELQNFSSCCMNSCLAFCARNMHCRSSFGASYSGFQNMERRVGGWGC